MSRKSPERLIIFTDYPEPGKVKTHLIPELGEKGAVNLHRRMVEHVLARALELKKNRGMEIEIRFDGADESVMRKWLGEQYLYLPQEQINLGGRMSRACRLALISGNERVVLVGTDYPGLSRDILAEVFDQLKKNDLVLGPGRDGGNYLIGLSMMIPNIFSNVEWGTWNVLQQTLDTAKKMNLNYTLLPELVHVERPGGLQSWSEIREQAITALQGQKISVIVPALNDSDHIYAAVESAARGLHVEIIVVDGGSRDSTRDIAGKSADRVIESPPGRAGQMNLGAWEAAGEYLLFLHAGCSLPVGYDSEVRQLLSRPGVSAGCFSLRVREPGFGNRCREVAANFLSRRLRRPCGQQAIFMTADTFRNIGGFPDRVDRENSGLVKLLRKKGKIITSPLHVRASAPR